MENFISILVLGFFSGASLTFMDRIDEHNLITGRFKTPLAYFFATLTSIFFIVSIENFNILYPLLFGLCVEWIIKNKLEYPSHVFFLFLVSIYFGFRLNLLFDYYLYIGFFLLLTFLLGTFLKNKLNNNSKFYKVFYKYYLSKFLINISFSILLLTMNIAFFSITFSYSCLFIKKYFPGKNP